MKDIKISLCIPTLNRFDTFLKNNLLKYLQNPLIDEIIISDENGNDFNKINLYFYNEILNKKIKIFKNEHILEPFLNKLNVCKKSKNEWVCLMDSDNFADEDYFKIIMEYIKNNDLHDQTILSPCFAKPNFDFRSFENNIITKNNLKEIDKKDYKNVLPILFNTGNYVLNKNLITNLNINNEISNIYKSSACDVIYMNTLFFEQFSNFELHILKNLYYTHVVHDDSIYLKTHKKYPEFNKEIYKRFQNLSEKY